MKCVRAESTGAMPATSALVKASVAVQPHARLDVVAPVASTAGPRRQHQRAAGLQLRRLLPGNLRQPLAGFFRQQRGDRVQIKAGIDRELHCARRHVQFRGGVKLAAAKPGGQIGDRQFRRAPVAVAFHRAGIEHGRVQIRAVRRPFEAERLQVRPETPRRVACSSARRRARTGARRTASPAR